MASDITVDELKSRMDENTAPLLIDVREPDEFAEFTIAELNIPLGQLPQRLWDLDEYMQSEIVVFCRSGKRSASAQMLLTQAGFTKVRNLEGGILKWQERHVK